MCVLRFSQYDAHFFFTVPDLSSRGLHRVLKRFEPQGITSTQTACMHLEIILKNGMFVSEFCCIVQKANNDTQYVQNVCMPKRTKKLITRNGTCTLVDRMSHSLNATHRIKCVTLHNIIEGKPTLA
jgi:hypothetical protein